MTFTQEDLQRYLAEKIGIKRVNIKALCNAEKVNNLQLYLTPLTCVSVYILYLFFSSMITKNAQITE